jgi:PAS domain-containing protein
MIESGMQNKLTESKRDEPSLLKQAELEQLQSQFFAMAPGLFATMEHRADGSYTMPFVSDGVRELFDLEPEAVMRDIGVLVARAHPDDIEMTFRKTEESEHDQTPYHVEYRIIHPTKGVRWLEVRSMPQRLPDGGTRWTGFYHDITERKNVQRRMEVLERAINLSTDAIFLIDEQLRFNYVNETVCRSLDRKSVV